MTIIRVRIVAWFQTKLSPSAMSRSGCRSEPKPATGRISAKVITPKAKLAASTPNAKAIPVMPAGVCATPLDSRAMIDPASAGPTNCAA